MGMSAQFHAVYREQSLQIGDLIVGVWNKKMAVPIPDRPIPFLLSSFWAMKLQFRRTMNNLGTLLSGNLESPIGDP